MLDSESGQTRSSVDAAPPGGWSTESPTEPGWYNDPEGRYSHQAYWDGETWTGVIRPQPRPRKSTEDKVIDAIAWVIIVIVVIFVLGMFLSMWAIAQLA